MMKSDELTTEELIADLAANIPDVMYPMLDRWDDLLDGVFLDAEEDYLDALLDNLYPAEAARLRGSLIWR